MDNFLLNTVLLEALKSNQNRESRLPPFRNKKHTGRYRRTTSMARPISPETTCDW
ncbi:hypothetical protein POX_a01633 [Penicillium oxalicum]|uniref:Uncharacterized protein n=1 Tax=Penicillium oxalicum (strain 114-2 / CGMCC 5302) TaxID=933388 RepID=S8BEC9_PENO1|nr:hypothetical protein POX_a01633 [Penicillium oxalicum]EPS33382.1 hypothetical protein PDE_08344 [Penicillium oxalicum 114-2]KAI2795030.1 hypothetical protein POX_a01633 [Penicillium oxalicum]